MSLEDIKKRWEAASKGPWKHSYSNWNVEGPEPARWTICSLSRSIRDDSTLGGEIDENGQIEIPHNPVDSIEDGDFIAHSWEDIRKLIAVAEAAKTVTDAWCIKPDCKCFICKALAELEEK